ncbi:MAG: hypothetical protein ABIQ97_07495 [Lysobacteraceae bacterium]
MSVSRVGKGHVILSHGLNSSPDATKVTALARVAEQLGWSSERPDFAAIDRDARCGRFGDIDTRLELLRERARAAATPLVLVGSSLGAFVSALVSLEIDCIGLYLMAPPPFLDGYPRALTAASVPTTIVHGWDDELIPAATVINWAAPRRDRVLLVNDSHRLAAHVDFCARQFREFLQSLQADTAAAA